MMEPPTADAQLVDVESKLKDVELKLKELELKHKRWEVLVKLSGVLTVVFPVIVFLWSIQDAKNKDAATREREAAKPFLDKQFALYMEAAKVASELATLEEGADRVKARDRFNQLYWGELSVVEDAQVEAAMVRFNRALTENDKGDMRNKAYELAHTCRESLAKTWKSELPTIGLRPSPSPSATTAKQ